MFNDRVVRWQLFLVLLCALGCDARPAPQPSLSTASAPALSSAADRRAPQSLAMRQAEGIYYLALYTGSAKAEDTLPMIVAIHGLGDRPDRFVNLVQDLPVTARVILPRGLTPWRGGFSWFEIDPTKIDGGMKEAAARLARLFGALSKRYPTRGRPVVTGFSQGGMLSFALAVRHPDSVSAAIPISGWIGKELMPATAPKEAPPITALHGDADPLLRIEPTRKAVGQLRDIGFDVQLREYPEVRHTVSGAMKRDVFRELVGAIGRLPAR